jgi:hypothetical protein
MGYYRKLIDIIYSAFKHIFPKAIVDDILVDYLFNVKKVKQFKYTPWGSFTANCSSVCTNDTIYILSCSSTKRLFEINVNTFDVKIKNISDRVDIHSIIKVEGNPLLRIAHSTSDFSHWEHQPLRERAITIDDIEKIKLPIANARDEPSFITVYGDIIITCLPDTFYKFDCRSINSGIKLYGISCNDRGNAYKKYVGGYKQIINHAVISGDILLIFTQDSISEYNVHTFALLHKISINQNKKIMASCTNSTCLFILRMIDPKTLRSNDDTKLCINVFNMSVFGNGRNVLTMNKPDKIINLSNTAKYNDTKYIFAASDEYLFASNDEYQLDIFKLFC